MSASAADRVLPVGAELVTGGVRFRVWAPKRREVDLVLANRSTTVRMASEEGGYFSCHVREAKSAIGW